MKLRIKGNSIRLRVSRSELDRLAHTGSIEEAVQFGPSAGQRLVYGLRRSASVSKLAVRYEPGSIIVVMPDEFVDQWKDPNQIGFQTSQDVGAGQWISILIEKDFTCSDGARGEDQQDTFANPNAAMAPGATAC